MLKRRGEFVFLRLSSQQNRLISKRIDGKYLKKVIDKKGTARHFRLCYEAELLFELFGFHAVERCGNFMNIDLVMYRRGFFVPIECGLVGSVDRLPELVKRFGIAVHIGYSRRYSVYLKHDKLRYFRWVLVTNLESGGKNLPVNSLELRLRGPRLKVVSWRFSELYYIPVDTVILPYQSGRETG